MNNLITLAAPNSRVPAFLPALAKFATLGGAIVSLICTFMVGQHNRSIVLVGLFVAWVLSPFLGLIWARRFAYWYSFAAQAMIYALIFLVGLASTALYAYAAFGPRWSHPAQMFLAVPLISWFLIGSVVLVVWLSLGERSRRARRP